MLLYCCMLRLTFMLLYQKRGSSAVLKLFNRSHKSKKTRPNKAAPPPYREWFLHSEFRGFVIRSFSVAISLNLRK